MNKKAIERQMIAKMNNCHAIGIQVSYLSVLNVEYDAALERGNTLKAHYILELINEDINS